jgi:hypothetical protein
MSLAVSESTTTWDTVRAGLLQPIVREGPAPYVVRVKTPLDSGLALMQGTTSADIRFWLGETSDPSWDASVETAIWPIEGRRLPSLARPFQAEERGPFGGRLISLAEACKLADQIALEAERGRQEARERDALYWGDLEDET